MRGDADVGIRDPVRHLLNRRVEQVLLHVPARARARMHEAVYELIAVRTSC